MIYIETNSNDLAYNLALEYYFAALKPLPDTVFLFWPTEPTLIVGKFQNVLEEINKPYADVHGIKIVRRMSGGGTIYSDEGNYMYTFIERQSERQIEFHRYLTPVIDALAEMGVEASFNGRNDLVIDGRKFSGNSQYHLKDRVVHHGTMMFDVDVEAMVASTTVDSYKITSRSIKSVRERVTNIAEHLPAPMDMEMFKEIMVRHIMLGNDALSAAAGDTDISIRTPEDPSETEITVSADPKYGYPVYRVTPEDDDCIRQIADEKFRGWENIYGRSPKFNIDRTGRYAGGKIQFRLEVSKGIITEAAVYGDFFASVDADTIAAALVGCRYERGAVLKSLRGHGLDGAVYRISAEEMAGAIAD